MLLCQKDRGKTLPERLFILPEGARGERITKGNIVSLGSLGGLEPIRKGSKFFVTFFQKK